jgi:hypothetical protein
VSGWQSPDRPFAVCAKQSAFLVDDVRLELGEVVEHVVEQLESVGADPNASRAATVRIWRLARPQIAAAAIAAMYTSPSGERT